MHEYDTKYVHPRLHPVVREVAIQVSIGDGGIEQESVNAGTTATLIRRNFQTHPNPNYRKFVDPDGVQTRPQLQPQPQPSNMMTPSLFSPASKPRPSDMGPSFASSVRRESRLRQSLPASPDRSLAPVPVPNTSTSNAGTSTSGHSHKLSETGMGGSLGVWTHMNSPLKKATSLGDMNGAFTSPRNSREMAAFEQREIAERMIQQMSPKKESRRATSQFDPTFSHSPNTLAAARANRWTQERFPSRRL